VTIRRPVCFLGRAGKKEIGMTSQPLEDGGECCSCGEKSTGKRGGRENSLPPVGWPWATVDRVGGGGGEKNCKSPTGSEFLTPGRGLGI